MTRAFALILLCLLGSGCIAKIPYTPNGGLIEELGEERAVEDFTDLMTGSVRAPGVVEVEVTDKAFIYRYTGANPWAWGAAWGEATVRVLFDTVARVDIYENNKTFTYDSGEQPLCHEFVFRTLADAKLYADFLASFKTRPPRKKSPKKPAKSEPQAEDAPADEGAQAEEAPADGE